jgi:hypothetical protein
MKTKHLFLVAGTLAIVGLVATFSLVVAAEDIAKARQLDNPTKLAEIAKILDAAQKAADQGDAKAAAAQIAKASAVLEQLQASVKQSEGDLISVDNQKCPIMDMAVGKVPESLTRIYKGRRIGFCCHDCPQMWDRLSEAEKNAKFQKIGIAEQKMVKVDNVRCPIMGMAVSEVPEKNVREYKGKKLGFCCGDCPAAWDKLSDSEKEKKFTEAMKAGDKAVKVDNIRCPIMGMALAEAPERNTRDYHGKKIGFCCSDCPVAWDKLSETEKEKKLADVLPKAKK